MGRTGQDRTEAKGRGRAGRAGVGQDRTGQESTGQCKGQCIGQYRKQHTVGQDKRHDQWRDWAEGRAEWTTGQRQGVETVVGET